MGILQSALETYDNLSHLAGVAVEGKTPLAPVGFNTAKANVEITIDSDGNFVSASTTKEKIFFPVTEESANRTGKSAKHHPHPLCDKLMYMRKANEKYVNQLEEWCLSEFTDKRIEAVLKYVKKGTIENDISEIKNIKDESFICWKVLSGDINDSGKDVVCKNPDIIQKYTNYYLKKSQGKKGFCYIKGKMLTLTDKHMKGVVPKHSTAKMISANKNKNDKENFVYRGRFINSIEACTISFEASQKAHNALKWIVENDGVNGGDRTFVVWNPHGKEMPKPVISVFSSKNDEEKVQPTNYKDKLLKILEGYRQKMDFDDKAVIAIFDAATEGRLAITYYNEMPAFDFLERLRFWDETCKWLRDETPEGNSHLYYETSHPLRSIVDAAFGILRDGDDEKQEIKTEDKMIGQQMQRLFMCRLEKSKFPADIMRAAVNKCENLQVYSIKNREEQLSSTCAIIKKYRYDHKKEEWSMALEPNKKDRSYQYGRLLAVMEKAERDTYGGEEKRETNAIRLQSVFVKRPAYAAKIVLEQLKSAYYPHLSVGAKIYYEGIIGEIMEIISQCEPSAINKPLGETYLLGYYLQKNELYKKKNSNVDEEEE